jgi:1,2-diacylglycerol 3-alpha-glucosyltransferase
MMGRRDRNVCMICDDFLPAFTGVGIHVQNISQELARRGYRVIVIAARRPGQPDVEMWQGIKICRVFSVKVYGYHQALPSRSTIRKILQDNNVSLIHHHYLGLLLKRAERVAASLQLQQVYTYHMTPELITEPWPLRPYRKVINHLVKNFCNRINTVIAPSEKLASQIVRQGIRTPVRYITNPVGFGDASQVAPAFKESGFTVFYVGRLAPEKNLPYLLAAFGKLIAKVPDTTLWIAGQGPEGEQLKKLCKKMGLSARVRFLGYLEPQALAPYYAACDVFVLPSIEETQSIVALEAMWFGKPLIVTNRIISATELVEPGVNGYIVNADSTDDLSERLYALSQDSALRAQMGAAGSKKARAYRLDPMVDELESVYGDTPSVSGSHQT